MDGGDAEEAAVTGRRGRRMLSAVPDESPAPDEIFSEIEQPVVDAPSGVQTYLQERLYGEGFSLPGGAAFALELVDAALPDGPSRVLDLTAGLGGGVRAIAEEYGIHVDGMEANHHLAERGMVLSARGGLGTQAPITAYDPTTFSLPEQEYDVIIVRERLYALPDKTGFLDEVRPALVPGGRLLFTDFVAADETPSDVLDAWRAAEPASADPWSRTAYEDYFQSNGFVIDGIEDVTKRYRQAVLQDWARFAASLTRSELTLELFDEIAAEGTVVQRRFDAFNSDALVVLRGVATLAT